MTRHVAYRFESVCVWGGGVEDLSEKAQHIPPIFNRMFANKLQVKKFTCFVTHPPTPPPKKNKRNEETTLKQTSIGF